MLEIDGSQKSGSGTILRMSIALSGIRGEPVHIYNIRKRRSQPGLRPQHLESVLTATKLCGAEIKGATLGSTELWFTPDHIKSGEFKAEIGTAGSIPLLLLTVLPICACAERPISLHVTKGGTDVDHSPAINYLRYVLLPTLTQMGLKTSLDIKKYGYYPKGLGEVVLRIHPCSEFEPINLEDFGIIKTLHGLSVCTFLADRKVAARQAKEAKRHLKASGLEADIQSVNDTSNPLQRGSSLVLWMKTSTGALLGGDAIGKIRKSSEDVGREAAKNLLSEIKAKATMDVHLADMIVPYVALARGTSVYLTRSITEHLDTNMWLTNKILGVRFQVKKCGKLYRIEKR